MEKVSELIPENLRLVSKMGHGCGPSGAAIPELDRIQCFYNIFTILPKW